MKRPEKSYYTLTEAAEMLGCSATDMLHYGATGHLKINMYLNLDCIRICCVVGHHDEHSLGYNGHYCLTRDDLKRLESGDDDFRISYFFPIRDNLPRYSYSTVFKYDVATKPYEDDDAPYSVYNYEEAELIANINRLFVLKEDLIQFNDDTSKSKLENSACEQFPTEQVQANKGGRPSGSLKEVIEHVYQKLLVEGKTSALREGRPREFLQKLKEMATENGQNADEYVLERIRDVKMPKNGLYTVTIQDREIPTQGGRFTKDPKTYGKDAISKLLSKLRKEHPIPS